MQKYPNNNNINFQALQSWDFSKVDLDLGGIADDKVDLQNLALSLYDSKKSNTQNIIKLDEEGIFGPAGTIKKLNIVIKDQNEYKKQLKKILQLTS